MGLNQVLAPGLKLSVDVPRCPGGRFWSTLVGLSPERYLIVENGERNGVPLPLENGDDCIVRFVVREDIYGFPCRVMGRITWPDHLVFLSYPERIDSMQLLKGKRFQVLLDAVVAESPVGEHLAAQPLRLILALAADGCLVDSDRPEPLRVTRHLTFHLPGQGLLRNLRATVKSVRTLAGRHQIVLAFEPDQDEALARLAVYLKHLDQLQMDAAMERLSCLDGSTGEA